MLSITVVGDAIARPLLDQIETGSYDLSRLAAITNGGATLSPTVRDRILAALPHVIVLDAVGASESGMQMTTVASKGVDPQAATFAPQPDTAIVAADYSEVPADGEGWLARRVFVPLGYLNDPDKTARTFPTIDGCAGRYPATGRGISLTDGSNCWEPRLGDHQLGRGENLRREVERAVAKSSGGVRRRGGPDAPQNAGVARLSP